MTLRDRELVVDDAQGKLNCSNYLKIAEIVTVCGPRLSSGRAAERGLKLTSNDIHWMEYRLGARGD